MHNTGTISHISPRGAMFVVRDDAGEFAVFELHDSIELAVGDRVRGELDALGAEKFLHLGHRETFDVYGQTGPCPLEECRRLIAAF